VRVRLLLGPAGAGKTYRCLTEIREALQATPRGPALLLIAPKQSTFQLERQLLSSPELAGYTRLRILSFERLARFVFDWLRQRAPKMLDEEGRLMVLRSLLARKRDQLKLFRASARLTGFAQELSEVLRELQSHQLTPDSLNQLAQQVQDREGLAFKLRDLAAMLQDYLEWLRAHDLHDADDLLGAAAQILEPQAQPIHPAPRIERLWVDGFAELSPQELALLAALMPYCQEATVTFCLDRHCLENTSWLSSWSVIRKNFDTCRKRFESLPGAEVSIEELKRNPEQSRFPTSPVLRHLEQHWEQPAAYSGVPGAAPLETSLRVVQCPSPEVEAKVAAREILRYVRAGGRYREVSVLVRQLAAYHEPLQRTFSRYEIPFFLDRRESVSHHPLAELTRNALRVVLSNWRHEDWFAALKTGLAPVTDEDIDRLENEALARGWQGTIWHRRITVEDEPELTRWLAGLHRRLVPPFQRLALVLAARQNKSTGPQLAAALREFWRMLKVEQTLEQWAGAELAQTQRSLPNSVHSTVWSQMNAWLANVELGFPAESLPLRQWLPILEAGLANLTVGVVPPALDQVIIGAVDRSRNPDIKLAVVLGLNETLFPATPQPGVLLTEGDRLELERRHILLGATTRQHLGRERFHAYIACTRARQRLVLTYAVHDASGAHLNPSPILAHLKGLFPELEIKPAPPAGDWRQSEHLNELIVPLLKIQSPQSGHRKPARDLSELVTQLPVLGTLLHQVRQFQAPSLVEALAPELAGQLYGPVLRSSVSRLEQFAACPFKFFVQSGLGAQERQKFELDAREQGSFQHEVLACFHHQLRLDDRRWRDLTPAQARERIERIAHFLLENYRGGLLQANEQSRFMARVLIASLQDFVETLVGWMREQYQFDPVEVELPFGETDESPAWAMTLDDGHQLELRGRIDRIDLWRVNETEARCVVVDYKSSHKELDAVLMAHGLQLQLPAYLSVLRHWPNPRRLFGVDRLVPAGVFYVNLRGRPQSEKNRDQALADPGQARKSAYVHHGRFDLEALRQLDGRPEAREGDQFEYRLTQSGHVDKRCRDALPPAQFAALLDAVETNLKRMGRQIFSGQAEASPFRKGAVKACDYCDYRAICRIDPWTHRFRVLRKEEK